MRIDLGYGDNFVEITDKNGGGSQSIAMPIALWDQFVMDYLQNRREQFRAAGLVEGMHFDDKTHDAEF
jgi:hypothetical protein